MSHFIVIHYLRASRLQDEFLTPQKSSCCHVIVGTKILMVLQAKCLDIFSPNILEANMYDYNHEG